VAAGALDFRNIWPFAWHAGGDLRSFRAHSLRFPLMYRAGTTDSKVIIGTIVREEYATPLLPDRAGVIIDAGANVGDVSCWLLSRYPDAIVIAIEPSPDTFAVLKQNLEPYGPGQSPSMRRFGPGLVIFTLAVKRPHAQP